MKSLLQIETYIEEVGNDFLDSFLIPALKTGKTKALQITHLDSLEHFSQYSDEIKMKNFIYSSQQFGYNKIFNTIDTFSDSEKFFLLETIKNTIKLNDFVQISLMTYLTNEYFNNNESLTYWQKSLYYNMPYLSEDDFKMFIKIMDTSQKMNNKGDIFYILNSKDVLQQIVKEKFINLSILSPDGDRMYSNNTNFLKTQHAEDFLIVLKEIFTIKKYYSNSKSI